MKGYFIPFGSRDIVSVNKKINMQIGQLSCLGPIEEVDVKIVSHSFIRNVVSIFPYIDLPWDYSAAYKYIKDPDYIFIRRTGADRLFINFLNYIKKKYPNCKIIVEIPTYPYIKESLRRIDALMLLPKELHNRRKLKQYVDRFVTYSKDRYILGVPTICTLNGIDVNSIVPIRKRNNDLKTVHMIAVAVMRKAHGYERIIKGIRYYYDHGGTRKIQLHMVGDGKERRKYEQLVRKLNLTKQVIFYGKKTGEELDEVYDKANLALSMFGLYKDGINYISSLKAKEYLAKGLPVVSGCREDVFADKAYDYFLEVPNDKSIVDIQCVIDFFDTVYHNKTQEEVIREIRQFAASHVDMCIAMKPIIEYLS